MLIISLICILIGIAFLIYAIINDLHELIFLPVIFLFVGVFSFGMAVIVPAIEHDLNNRDQCKRMGDVVISTKFADHCFKKDALIKVK